MATLYHSHNADRHSDLKLVGSRTSYQLYLRRHNEQELVKRRYQQHWLHFNSVHEHHRRFHQNHSNDDDDHSIFHQVSEHSQPHGLGQQCYLHRQPIFRSQALRQPTLS